MTFSQNFYNAYAIRMDLRLCGFNFAVICLIILVSPLSIYIIIWKTRQSRILLKCLISAKTGCCTFIYKYCEIKKIKEKYFQYNKQNKTLHEALGQVILPLGLPTPGQYHLPSGFINHDIAQKEVFYSVNICLNIKHIIESTKYRQTKFYKNFLHLKVLEQVDYPIDWVLID